MEFHFRCMDCAKYGKECQDMTGTEPAGSCFISHDPNKQIPFITNGDVIREMPDRILAAFLHDVALCCQQDACSECPLTGCDGTVQSIQEWLRKESDVK